MAKSKALKKVRGSGVKAQKGKERRNLGTLAYLSVTPAVRTRYSVGLQRFFRFLEVEGIVMPQNSCEVDGLFCQFLEMLWAEGDPRSWASDALCGCASFVPVFKGKLPAAWALYKTWGKFEEPRRSFPISAEMCRAIAGFAGSLGFVGIRLGVLVGFQCLLRTGELLSLSWGQIEFNTDGSTAIIDLGYSKSGKRTGIREQVVVDDRGLIQVMARLGKNKKPGDLLVGVTAAVFRGVFAQCLQGLELGGFFIKPYSLRRGGATELYRVTVNHGVVMERGRWNDLRTCRIYVNQSHTELVKLKMTPAAKKLVAKFDQVLVKSLRGR